MSRDMDHDWSRRGVLGAGAAILLLAGVLMERPAWAKTPRLEIIVDLADLTVGQTVSARVRLTDGVARGRPQLSVGAGLLARYTGQSQQHTIINFESTRIVEYSYAITAQAVGDYAVGPAQVQIGSSKLQADPVMVAVRPRTAAQRASNNVQASLSSTEPYLGQVVVFRFQHRHTDRVLNLDWTPPGLDGFVVEKLAESDQKTYQVEQDGVTWQVEDIFMPLVATAVGERTISPAILTAQVPGRAGARHSPFLSSVESRTLSSDPISTRIRALPMKGRPSDFSGLVGHFQLSAKLGAQGQAIASTGGQTTEVPLGQSLTLEITLRGDGSLAGATLPSAPPSSDYRVYDDDPEITAQIVDGAFHSQAVFRRAIVPTAQGDVTVAPVALTVFDPMTGRYDRLRTAPLHLRVVPGEPGQGVVSRFGQAEQGQADTRTKVASLGEDILPVVGGVRVRDRSLGPALRFALSLPALPALGLLGLAVQRAVRRRRPDPRALLRVSLASLPGDPSARLAALDALFRDACGLRLGRPAPGLDRAAVAALGPDAAVLYDALGRARYGGFQRGGDIEDQVRAFVEAT